MNDTSSCYCVADFEEKASKKLSDIALGHYNGGVGHLETLRDNITAFSRYKLRPRHMRNVSTIDMKQRVLGSDIEFPVIVAPFSNQEMAHQDREFATARACAAMGTIFTFSSYTSTSIEELAAKSPAGQKWLQLYLTSDRTVMSDIVRRAECNGFKAILVTIDIKIPTNRLADKRNKFNFPTPNLMRPSNSPTTSTEEKNYQYTYPTLSWDDIIWIKSITNLPIAVKGVMTAEDAIEAAQHGVDGIIVSNHGGRALDSVEASIDALAEIVEAVKHTGIDILMDGGIRKGSDVIKALALGAKAVLVARPIAWGLTVEGEKGVKAVLTILRNELENAMGLCGCASLADIDQTVIKLPVQNLSKL